MADPRVVADSTWRWFGNPPWTLTKRRGEGWDCTNAEGIDGFLFDSDFARMEYVSGPASPPKVEPPAVPMALVGERWRWPNGSLEMTITGLRVGCHCDEGGVSHVEVETEGSGVHCPVLIARLCTRISPAPQQPAPEAETSCLKCGWEGAWNDVEGHRCKRPPAAPEVVPEAVTEPAQLPICGRLTPAGYPCEVRGEHPATGCRVLTEAPARQPAIVHAMAGATKEDVASTAICYCSTCFRPGPGLSAADIAALASPRGRR